MSRIKQFGWGGGGGSKYRVETSTSKTTIHTLSTVDMFVESSGFLVSGAAPAKTLGTRLKL